MKKLLSVLLAAVMLLTCIPLGAVSVSAENSGNQNRTDTICYTDLFYAYPHYLAEDTYLATYAATTENVYSSVYESYANSPLVVGTGLENALSTITSPTAIAGLITDSLGITNFSYNDALDAANEEFLKRLLSDASIFSAGDTFAAGEKFCKDFGEVCSAFNDMELGDTLTVEEYVQSACNTLSQRGVFSYISNSMVSSLIDEINDSSFDLSACFKLAETEFNIAEAIVYCILLEDIRIGLVNDILSTQTSNTVLKQGMTRLKNQMTNSFSVRFCNQFMKTTVADTFWSTVDSIAEGAMNTSQLNAAIKLVNFGFNLVVDVPEYAEVLKWQVLMCYSRELAMGLPTFARTFANGPLLSNEISRYEALFAAYDAINMTTLDIANSILAQEDPFGKAYMVLVEAANNGEATVTLTSGAIKTEISSSTSQEDFYNMMRLGVLNSVASTIQFGNIVTVSNKNTSEKIPRKANALFNIFRTSIDSNYFLIQALSSADAYAAHISNVKSTIQRTPVSERVTLSKDVYSKWTYTIDSLTQLRHGSDSVQKNSVYAVHGKVLGNIKLRKSATLPEERITIDGNITIAESGVDIANDLSATGTLSVPKYMTLTISGDVEVNQVTCDESSLYVYGKLNCQSGYDASNKSSLYLYGDMLCGHMGYSYTSTFVSYEDSVLECNVLEADGISTVYGVIRVHEDMDVDESFTVEKSGKVYVTGLFAIIIFGTLVNKGYIEVNGNFMPCYDARFDNYGTFKVSGDVLINAAVLGSPGVELNNYGTMWMHTLNLETTSRYTAQSDEAILYVSGDINWNNNTHYPKEGIGGILVFNGTEQQTTTVTRYSTVLLRNTSLAGVYFSTYSTSCGISKLFDHFGNNYSIYRSNYFTFVDYDGDGMKDNVDPQPTVGNPCCVNFASEDTAKGSVTKDIVEELGGTEITVEAIPTAKFEFLHWVDESGNVVSTSAKWKMVIKKDATYIAVFQKRAQPITVQVENGVITTPTKAEIESTVSVAVTENAGYVYEEGSLSYNGIPIVNNTFVMPDEPVVLTANFARNDNYFALTDKIAAAKSYTYDLYTTESFTVLMQVIATAEGVLNNYITKAESDAQIALLQQAIDGLVARGVVSIDVVAMPKFYVNVPSAIGDLMLRVTYDNGVTKDVSASECIVSNFEISALGNQTIILTYEGFAKEVDVCVELRNLAECTGLETVDMLFDGQTQEYVQSFQLTYPLTGETLVEGVDYALSYTNNKQVGEATVTITGMGLYAGSVMLTYQIYCEHIYDNACDNECNICSYLRTPDEHTYTSICDATCNACGFKREAKPHDYRNDELFECVSCGMTTNSLLSVNNFEDTALHNLVVQEGTVISEVAARTGEYGLHMVGTGGWGGLANHYVDTVVGRKYELSFWIKVNSHYGTNLQIRDSINGTQITSGYYGESYSSWTRVKLVFVATSTQTQLVFSGSGAGEPEDVYLDDICLTAPVLWGGMTSVSEDVNGLAFKFDVVASNGQVVNGTHYVNGSASVEPFVDGQSYALVRMGAIASNKSDAILDLENVDNERTLNINAVYLCNLLDTSLSFAVRITDIPENQKDTMIYARPYYVYEKDGKEVIVYGETMKKAYNAFSVYNGDFECGDKSNWNCSSGEATIVTDAHSGKYALQISNPGIWGEAASCIVEVKPNTQYEVSWYAKRVSGTGAFSLVAHQTVSPWSSLDKISGTNRISETSGEWVKYTCTFDSGENTTQMKIKFTAGTENAGSIIIDDITIKTVKQSSYDGYLYDGDFETGGSVYWMIENGEYTTETSATGSYAFKGTASAKYATFAVQTVSVEPNTNYTISFKTKAAAADVLGKCRLQVRDAADTSILNNPAVWSITTDSWTVATTTFNSGDNNEVLIHLAQGMADGGSVYYDDFVMQKITGFTATFEDGSLADWQGSTSAPVSVVADSADADNHCLEFDASIGNWNSASRLVTVEPNTDYTISFRMKSNYANGMFVRFLTKDWTTTLCSVNVTTSTEWNMYTVTLNSGDNTQVWLLMQSNGVAGQKYWFDDFACAPC